MPNINVILKLNQATGKFESTVDLQVVGSVGHGLTMTMKTDGTYDFGARTNAKPLYVNLGVRAGSSYGRDTADYYHALAQPQSLLKVGSLSTAIQFDLKAVAVLGEGIFQFLGFDTSKPLINYIERYYAFDITDRNAQGPNGAGTGIAGFNLKTNRYWVDTSPSGAKNDAYIGYQGSEGATSVRMYVENVTGNTSQTYGIGVPANSWLSEEFIFINSSAANVADGELRHYRSNVLQNSGKFTITTRDTAHPNPIAYAVLDQNSNGCGEFVSNVYMYTGYQCWDDEYRGVYVGNASTRAACTKMVRLPQTSWSSNEVTFLQVYSVVDSSERYFYMRTGKTSWLSDVGVR